MASLHGRPRTNKHLHENTRGCCCRFFAKEERKGKVGQQRSPFRVDQPHSDRIRQLTWVVHATIAGEGNF